VQLAMMNELERPYSLATPSNSDVALNVIASQPTVEAKSVHQ
jgi:hypothetical protein